MMNCPAICNVSVCLAMAYTDSLLSGQLTLMLISTEDRSE